MSVTLEEVRHVARLARLAFTPGEEVALARDLDTILAYMQQLDELDAESAEPTGNTPAPAHALRDDTVEHRIDRDTALRQAPEADDRYFSVPRVID